jgi:ribosome-binding protein aMBF1 (putative translation factor)
VAETVNDERRFDKMATKKKKVERRGRPTGLKTSPRGPFIVLEFQRRLKGLKQYELAEAAGTSQMVISFAETGRAMPSLYQLQKIAKALKYKGDPESLLDEVQG